MPTIIKEKKIPMDSGIPTLLSVAIIPELAPLCLCGTLFIIAAVLGAINIPIDMPLRKITMANRG